ncbi:MAG TPA: tRNA (N(6)-L-threonylcarbamoyladenosine(37)-C(2))-methylthiotransferase MtaB [Peptococcaceae bacterium]|nr:MAG: RNA modification enzyme, MiaB family [Clostridia bacterium 41_269]HBT20312.1 tRNA (N(6)-L-threonylcarbamoyladenosine(37)-C(2))-methylthiotransferase MtaB [Peptococcaceae bacterium]
MNRKKAAVYVLGCKVNQAEAEAIAQMFSSAGYEIVDFSQKAHVYVIHTCTVTKESDRKCRQAIRRAVKLNPDAVIAVTGCYAQTSFEDVLSIEGVDVVVGTSGRNRIVELVEEALNKKKTVVEVKDISHEEFKSFEELPLYYSKRARAFLKIQEGCEEFCTYCIIPYARGPIRSMPREDVLRRIREITDRGYKEVVISGIRLGAYGRDFNPPYSLAELLTDILNKTDIKRLRLSSIDPQDFTPQLVEVLASEEAVCPHFHIPLQSGDDYILKRMGRKYTTEQYARLIKELRSKRPEASITTDVMVGFPGEKEENFLNTLNFIEKIGFMDVHVFKFSPRRRTPAYSFPDQVPGNVKKERGEKIQELAGKLYRRFASAFLGKTLDVLVEQLKDGLWVGHAPNYLLVKFPSSQNLQGKIIRVKIVDVGDKFAVGEGMF